MKTHLYVETCSAENEHIKMILWNTAECTVCLNLKNVTGSKHQYVYYTVVCHGWYISMIGI